MLFLHRPPFTDFLSPFHRPTQSRKDPRPSPPSANSTPLPSRAKLYLYPHSSPTPPHPKAPAEIGEQCTRHLGSPRLVWGAGQAFRGAPGQAVFTCSRRPPPAAPACISPGWGWHGGPISVAALGSGDAGRAVPRALRTRRCPAPPLAAPNTGPPLGSRPLSPNLPLTPLPTHWPPNGRVTRGLAPIRRDLRVQIPSHPPADCQPIRNASRRASPNPSRRSQWQWKTSAPARGRGAGRPRLHRGLKAAGAGPGCGESL